MKKILSLMLLCTTIVATSQVTNEGTPRSWKAFNDHDQISTKKLPSFDLEAIKAEDAINDTKFEKPWRFGYMHSVDYGFEEGTWTTLENGDRIWRIAIESKGALSMNFIFDDFYVPKGGSVYLYSDDRNSLLGAYTDLQNQDSGILGTWLVEGEKIWIEYFEPSKMKGQGRLHIAKATHGYRNAESFTAAKGLNDSGDCNLDVDCTIGADQDPIKDHNKRSVGILLSGGAGFCTGALINNTNNDGTPYFLTANHCFSNPAAWSFRFGWISPNAVCASTDNSSNGPTTQTLSGATLRARSTNADFCLVEINNPIPAAWNRVFAGWDRSDDAPDFTVGIHHPRGDVMKVCRDDNAPTKEVNAGAQTWEILGGSGLGWELGVTEPGSSGSPLFDPEGRIIGQLFGGGAACSGTNDNNAFDYYGRFAVSWDQGGSPATRLEDWLDPAGTDQEIVNSNPPFEVLALDAAVSISIPDIDCEVTEVMPIINLTNFGENTITSAVIEWQLNGGTVETINFSGTLAQNQSESFDLSVITNDGDYTISAEIIEINGNQDENNVNDSTTVSFDLGGGGFSTEQVILNLLTDEWAQETTWEFRTIDGAILYEGGPYQTTTDDNTLFIEEFDVTQGECYVFEIFDSASDGICCGFGLGEYSLSTAEGEVIFEGGEFSANEATEIKISAELSVSSQSFKEISLYPNPSNSQITIALNANANETTYFVSNTLGQQVTRGMFLGNNASIDVTAYTSGIYFITLIDALSNNEITLKFIKQ